MPQSNPSDTPPGNVAGADRPPPPRQGRRGEVLVVLQVALVAAFLFTIPWNPWLTPDFLALTQIPRVALLALCGFIALAIGGLGVLKLGTNLTPLPYPLDHNRLVTQGIYALIRHPLYSSQLFAALGWVIYSLSLSHLLLLVIGFLFFDYKATQEEAWLTERHPAYADYARGTRKLIPWWY
ncbi:MAG: isoprenylcysteine carboxylmethyltransferase family protein [Gammaproteobacteria bacterium]|nr:isoprenylcysteine carboxylmethyltransferase family protein [Gammaproteobacteria bacterium]